MENKPLTDATYIRLRNYASLTAADMRSRSSLMERDVDAYLGAVESMRSESTEVARDLGVSVEVVEEWCRAERDMARAVDAVAS